MGLESSKEESRHAPLSSRFSTRELQKLEEYSEFKKGASDSPNFQKAESSISQRISKCFSDTISEKILKYLKSNVLVEKNPKSREKDSEIFLELVFHLTKDCINKLSSIVFNMASEGDKVFPKSVFSQFISDFIDSLMLGSSNPTLCFPADCQASVRLVEKILDNCPDKMTESNLEDVLQRSPLLVDILQFKFRMVFFDYIGDVSEEMRTSMSYLLPELVIEDKAATQDTFILSLPSLMYINAQVPMGMQHKWRLLYSTKLHGESFSKLTGAIVGQGPTLMVIRDQDGHVFGGFASANWEYSSQFQGTDKSFLFKTEPELGIYDCLGGSYNDHYMYLNIGQETMPNGLGMGGQLDFFGLWIDQEFGIGHSRAKPLCTTYKSPQLSKTENFKIEALNVWGVGEEPKSNVDEDDKDMSVLDKHVEAKALLEIAGKPPVSEGLRDADPEADIPETKELHRAHDPMS